jgi:8-oxo-dGTP diphosphatase
MNTIEKIEIHEKRPVGFEALMEVAACYLEIEGKILLLKQGFAKQEAGAWGVPVGKIEKHETPEAAARRELFEETGIQIEKSSQIQDLGCLYIRKPELDYVYHLFQVKLEKIPTVCITQEYQIYDWFSIQNLHNLTLLSDAKAALDHYLRRVSKANRTTNVNVYLILKQNDMVLLHLRKNTGYLDGFYGLVAGHVEAKESAATAMVREAYEEAGILLEISDLNVVHVMHRLTNRSNIDIFFECSTWQGEITNKEPEKCAALKFFPLERLPSNVISYIIDAFRAINQKTAYSEQGWKTDEASN